MSEIGAKRNLLLRKTSLLPHATDLVRGSHYVLLAAVSQRLTAFRDLFCPYYVNRLSGMLSVLATWKISCVVRTVFYARTRVSRHWRRHGNDRRS